MNPKRISKFLSLVLRHQPEKIGITLDAKGWIEIKTLLAAMKSAGQDINEAQLRKVVDDNDKQRFVIRDGRIRANQGHSIPIDLDLPTATPPSELFHGTAERFKASILASGLKPMSRQHVHLSSNIETARKVGTRHGKPLIFSVDASRMDADGLRFYVSENRVWLTDAVPVHYMTEIENAT